MSFSDYSILLPPYIAVTLAGEIADFTALQKGYNFGTVDTVNYLSNRASVGDTCLFNQTEATLITAGAVDYYIVDDRTVQFKPILPP